MAQNVARQDRHLLSDTVAGLVQRVDEALATSNRVLIDLDAVTGRDGAIFKASTMTSISTTTTITRTTSTFSAFPVSPEENQDVFVPLGVHRRFARNGNIQNPLIEDDVSDADSQGGKLRQRQIRQQFRQHRLT